MSTLTVNPKPALSISVRNPLGSHPFISLVTRCRVRSVFVALIVLN